MPGGFSLLQYSSTVLWCFSKFFPRLPHSFQSFSSSLWHSTHTLIFWYGWLEISLKNELLFFFCSKKRNFHQNGIKKKTPSTQKAVLNLNIFLCIEVSQLNYFGWAYQIESSVLNQFHIKLSSPELPHRGCALGALACKFCYPRWATAPAPLCIAASAPVNKEYPAPIWDLECEISNGWEEII